jgi:hypothetical protein
VDGPEVSVARLTRRLADTPRDFLAEPDQVSVAAVVSDVLRLAGGSGLDEMGAAPFRWIRRDRNRLRLVLITCWLVADDELVAVRRAERVRVLLTSGVSRLAELVDAERFVADPDRREELARITLRALGIDPAGESRAQADDRLSTVDSVRRQEVLVAARQAEERAAAVRKAMEEKRAQEAAARYSQV